MRDRRIFPVLFGGGQSWSPVSAPDAAFSYLPFSIEQNGSTFRPAAGWDVSSLTPTGKTYYFSSTGNDANDGLSLAQAKRNLYSCPADAVVIYLTAGHWGFTNNFRGAYPATIMAMIGIGTVIYSNDLELTSWTAEDTAYKATTTRTIGETWDKLNLDADGNYSRYTAAASIAACKSTAGSWYKDTPTNTIYVHCSDGRAPDTNIVVVTTASGLKPSGKTPYYFENIQFTFCAGSQRPFRAYGAGDAASVLYAKNCAVNYNTSSYDSWDVDGIGTIIMQDCHAHRGLLDGFNYHAQDAVVPSIIEIRCSGRWMGVTGDSIRNGSTIHDAEKIVRIMGEHYKTFGPVIADVNNCRSWNLGVFSHDSLIVGASNSSFYLGAVPDGSKQWLDTCRSSGSTYDIMNEPNSTTYHKNFTGTATNSISGTLTAYT